MGPKLKTGVGRPPKFREQRRPVTMTLPERILGLLAEIDPDRTCAVVKVTEAVMGTGQGEFKPVELVEMAPGKSLIVVGPNKTLTKIPWIKLIEITRARYLVSIPSGTPIETLEVALRDLSHDMELSKIESENNILQDLLHLIGLHRRSHHLSKEEILVVDTGWRVTISQIPALEAEDLEFKPRESDLKTLHRILGELVISLANARGDHCHGRQGQGTLFNESFRR